MRAQLIFCASILACFSIALAFPQEIVMMRLLEPSDDQPAPQTEPCRTISYHPAPTSTGSKEIPGFRKDRQFQAPAQDDLRGPCPALNTLANHGYLPRNGIATPEEIVDAVAEGFNMHFEFAQLLVSFATLARGNACIGKLSIGGATPEIPPLPGNLDGNVTGGIALHGRFEGDVSLSRDDAAIGGSVLFQENTYDNLLSFVRIYGDNNPDGRHTIADVKAFQEYKYWSFNEFNATDPKLDYPVSRQFSSYGEVGFALNMFANGTNDPKTTGNLSVEMMNSIFRDQTFGRYWFRRSSPADFSAITKTAGEVRDAYPIQPGSKKNGMWVPDPEVKPEDFLCRGYTEMVGKQLSRTLLKATDITLKMNINTLLDAIYKPFKDNLSNCPKTIPNGDPGLGAVDMPAADKQIFGPLWSQTVFRT